MTKAPTGDEVLGLIAEWLEAKSKGAKPVKTDPEPTQSGFGIFSFSGDVPFDPNPTFISFRDDGDEQQIIDEIVLKLTRASVAFELFVAAKIEEVLQTIVNQSNQRSSAGRPEHDLYPERG